MSHTNIKITHTRFPVLENISSIPSGLQNSITEECLEAYNSLVEKPSSSAAMGRFDYEKTKLEHLSTLKDLKIAATLPRNSTNTNSTQHHDMTGTSTKHLPTTTIEHRTSLASTAKEFEFTVPTQQAPRPSTLPYRTSMTNGSKSHEIDSNPLRILRDKNYPFVRNNKMKVCTIPIDGGDDGASTPPSIAIDPDAACESPSYLTNTEHTFFERDVNLQRAGGPPKQIATNKEIENLNPIPLPPRDRNKPMPTNVKRHIRKHPLIIPASGLQRTLNKVTSPSSSGDDTKSTKSFAMPSSTAALASSARTKSSTASGVRKPIITRLEPLRCKDAFDHSYMNQDDVRTSTPTKYRSAVDRYGHTMSAAICSTERTYENLETLRSQMQDCTDSASLHFESILEDDTNKIGEMSSPEVMNGFMFQIHKDHWEKPCASQLDGEPDDEIRNLDIARRKSEFSQKYPKFVAEPKNELADNVLFNKIRESVDAVDSPAGCSSVDGSANSSGGQFSSLTEVNEDDDQMLERKLKDSNSVSCEDLLEFSDKKPKGRERGIESDEVRIMTKVLGAVVSVREFRRGGGKRFFFFL